MVLSEAKAECARMNMTLEKDGDEYVIFPKGESANSSSAYFTMDMADAVCTARENSDVQGV